MSEQQPPAIKRPPGLSDREIQRLPPAIGQPADTDKSEKVTAPDPVAPAGSGSDTDTGAAPPVAWGAPPPPRQQTVPAQPERGAGTYSYTGKAVPFGSSPVAQPSRARPVQESRTAPQPQPQAAIAPVGEHEVKVGLWGSPQSGKTTYLAALRHAMGETDSECGSWNIYPLNPNSRELLVKFTHDLVQERKFPESTVLGATVPLQWMFVGDITESRFVRHRPRLFRRARVESRFVLDLIDVTGLAFADEPEKKVSPDVISDSLDHLAAAQGLIYLFDPIGERANRDSASYVNRTIAELSHRFVRRGQPSRYLPHHVSVCVTKFDHPEVFQQARRIGLVNYGPDGMPRVLDEHAETFFEALCGGNFWSQRYEQGDGSAEFIRNQLRNTFDPSRMRYFVTSSIGFWKPPGWDSVAAPFNPEDFANYYVKNGVASIKGAIRPINVLEPLISLQQRLAGRA